MSKFYGLGDKQADGSPNGKWRLPHSDTCNSISAWPPFQSNSLESGSNNMGSDTLETLDEMKWKKCFKRSSVCNIKIAAPY